MATAGHDGAKPASHRSQKFYFYIFVVLAIITVVEVALSSNNNPAIKVPTLFVLSAAKFALVVMFFMHLKGDRRLFGLVFVGPLLIGSVILVSLVGLFRNF